MTSCRIDPCVYSVRFYKNTIDPEKNLTEEQEKFTGSAVIAVQGKIAVVSALSGGIGLDGINSMFDQLKKMGVDVVHWERHKKGECLMMEKRL